MAKNQIFVRGAGIIKLLKDKDWIIIITSLMKDNSDESKELVKRLMTKTKHGRQIRLLRMINEKKPKLSEMQKAMKVTRRTIFRDLNCLEDYGVRMTIDEEFRYEIERVPAKYKHLL